jgi:murein DD-endopeptidase MepM/ murein hydrolase activator NlpD
MALAAASSAPSAAQNADGQLEVTASPSEIFVEKEGLQQLNFDFVVKNGSNTPVELKAVEMTIVDDRGKPILRRDVDGSGASPAIQTVLPSREFKPGEPGIFFNPFTQFATDVPLRELRYHLTFQREGSDEFYRDLVVRPHLWKPATPLILPLSGRIWVKHGHDYLSHHRRWNPFHPIAQSFGATATFARYALDLEIVDASGNPRKKGVARNDDFYGWGVPVRAPGTGIVVAAYDKDLDDDLATGKSGFDPERLPKEPLHFYGNYVIIDHGHGEYSLLGHLQHGSVTVRAGEGVRQGQTVAHMGTSGSAEFEPHLHYELRRGTTMSVEGLPAYFTDFDRLRGSSIEHVSAGPVNSGEFIKSRR